MFIKLALRNVKRQVGNYIIYFITVTLTVSFMFAVNNVIFSSQLQSFADSIAEMKAGLIGMSVFISLIIAFILGYATLFMLRLRKREFGTYLTLGMTRKNILTIFILETVIMGVVALAIGIFIGLFLYQGMMMIMASLMEIELVLSSYSVKGLVLTITLVCVIFILSSAISAYYLKKVSVYELIHADKKVSKDIKHPILWFYTALVSLIVIVGSCIMFSNLIEKTVSGAQDGYTLMLCLLSLAISIIMFHIALSRCIAKVMLSNKKFCSKGTNIFTLRQLSSKLSSNSMVAGVLAFLITFAVIGANVSFVQKMSDKVTLDKFVPFDIIASLSADRKDPIDYNKGCEIIKSFVEIENSIPYKMYTNDCGLHSFTSYTGDGYEGLTDSFISESDFNRLISALGKEPVNLHGTFMILTNKSHINQWDFTNAVLENNGVRCVYGNITDQYPLFSHYYLVAVVPDAFTDNMRAENECYAIDLKNVKFDARNLQDALSYPYTSPNGSFSYEKSDFKVKDYYWLEMNSSTAILIIGALYIGVIFVFMAMAILSLKILSGLSEDKPRFNILYRLGASTNERCKALFKQVFVFFIIPFAMPMLLSIPTAYVCGQIMEINGFGFNLYKIYASSALIALILSAIYVLYFAATYLIAKKNIIRDTI